MRRLASRSLAVVSLVLLVGGAAACTSPAGNGNCPPTEKWTPGGPCSNPQPTLAWVQQNVFTPNCALPSCHMTDTALTQHLVLDNAADSYASMVGVTARESTKKLVVPGHPEQSFLVDKIACQNLNPAVNGVSMPQNSDLLCPGKINAVEQWIMNGASPVSNTDGGTQEGGALDGRGPG